MNVPVHVPATGIDDLFSNPAISGIIERQTKPGAEREAWLKRARGIMVDTARDRQYLQEDNSIHTPRQTLLFFSGVKALAGMTFGSKDWKADVPRHHPPPPAPRSHIAWPGLCTYCL